MNMFRDLAMAAMIALAISLAVSDPLDWKWVAAAGPQVVEGINFLVTTRPFSIIVLVAVALALFMTRLKY
jgi:hypothetical protein